MTVQQDEVIDLLKSLRELPEPVYIIARGIVSPEEYEKDNHSDDKFIDENFQYMSYVYDAIPILFEEAKNFSYKETSYGLKHHASRMIGQFLNPEMSNTYITNGGFIVVMLLNGFEFKKTKTSDDLYSNPNCNFKFKHAQFRKKCLNCGKEKLNCEFKQMAIKTKRFCNSCLEFGFQVRDNGYNSVDDDIKKEINKYIEDGFALRRIAKKFSINYYNLYYWKKRGFLENIKKLEDETSDD